MVGPPGETAGDRSVSATAPTLARNKNTDIKSRVEAATVPGMVFFVYCYFLVDYFGRLAARLPVYPQLRPTLLLVAVLTIAAFMQAHKFRGVTQETTIRIMFVFLIYLFLSFPLVEWPGSIIRHNLPEFVKAAVFLFFTAFFVDTDKRLKIFVGLFLALQIFRVIEPLYLNLTEGYLGSRTHLGGGEFAGRLAGAPADVINPNGLGFVVATVLAFSHFMLWRSSSKWLKLAYLVLVPALLYTMVQTGSRGGFLALLVVLVMIFVFTKRKALFLIIIGVAAAGAWTQMNDIQRDRYLSLVSADTQQHATVDGRWRGIRHEFELGLNRPIFGHGLGTTSEAKVHFGGGRPQAAHNLYAEALIETGIIGFGIFMAFLGSCYLLLRRNMALFRRLGDTYTSSENYHYRLNLALITVFWMYAVYSFNYFGLSQEYWYVFAGLCVAFSRSLKRNTELVPTEETTPKLKSKLAPQGLGPA